MELKNGEYKYFPGDYVYYLDQIALLENAENQNDDNNLKKSKAANIEKSDNQKMRNISETKISWEEQKKRDSERRKIEKKIQKLETDIEHLETKKSELEKKLSDPAVYSNGEKAKAVQKEIEIIVQQIEQTTLEWEKTSEELI